MVQPKSDSHSHRYYLPISDELLHSGLYLTSTGCATIRPGACYPPPQHPSLYSFTWAEGRTLPEFSLILITRGRGIFEAHKKSPISVEAGHVIQLFPGVWHRYQPDRHTGWTEKWVQFNGEFAHKLLEGGVFSQDRPVQHPRNFQAVEANVDSLLEAVRADPTSNSLRLSLMALGVIAAVVKQQSPAIAPIMPRSPRASDDSVVATAVHFIWTSSHRTLSVLDVAEALGVTRRKLERHMAAYRGHSALEEIIRCRFSRAERLLRETNLPMKVVVSLAGFGSVQNMRHVFIGRTGCSPGDYRLRYRLHP